MLGLDRIVRQVGGVLVGMGVGVCLWCVVWCHVVGGVSWVGRIGRVWGVGRANGMVEWVGISWEGDGLLVDWGGSLVEVDFLRSRVAGDVVCQSKRDWW